MNYKNMNELNKRRDFLKKMGITSLSLLGGNMLWPGSLSAATNAPKRVVFVYTAGGAVPEHWMPSVSASKELILPAMSAPLESVKEHCVFLKGVNMRNPGHGLTSKALGNDRAVTLDIHMARTIGQVTPYSQLQLGVLSNGFGSISRNNWNEPAYEDNPLNAFDRLFGAGSSLSSTEDIATRQKRSVLDTNLEALNSMRSKLGSFEKARLDEHASSIRRVEARITSAAQASSGSTTPSFNTDGFNGAANNDLNFDTIADLQCDVATLALKSDLTRVVSIMFGNHQSDYLIPEAGVDTNYHQSIHGRPIEDYIKYRAYFAGKLKYLIQSLANTPDVDGGSLLDNTIILQVTDMADARAHTGTDVPYMLAGGGGGTLKTNRLVTLNGVSHDTILDTVAKAAGVNVNSADYQNYGDGPISGIFN
jgi:hypothetical protein